VSDRLRVTLLNPTFWPEVQRGSERMIGELAHDLVKLGHAPRVITSHPGGRETSNEHGYPVVRNRRPPDALMQRRGFQEHLSHVPLSYLTLTAGDDDVAHAFYPTDAAAGLRWARRTGRPALFSYMGVPQREVLAGRRLRLRLLSEAVNASDAVLALSEAAAAAMRRWLGVDPHVIYPGVDLDRFTPGGERDPRPTIACAAASDDSRKRVELLARAFRLVRRDRPEARLLLDRPRRDPSVAERLTAVSEGIEFFDAAPGGVAEVFRRAWVSALPSYNEAFGLVLVEALACGTPAVGTNDGGIPEIVNRPEVGRLFDGDDEAALARALLEALELASDPATAARCRERAERFSTARCAADHLALYRELTSAG
jgi:glycosyltransferase involved in cell wall biosynthesis